MDYKVNKGLPFWQFDHEAVLKRFNGTKFVNEFCINGSYKPYAVYYADTPDRSKQHKNYFFLRIDDDQLFIGGMDSEEMEKWRYQDAIYCTKCQDVIYSKYRHDMMYCSCGNVSIDGGREYTRVGMGEEGSSVLGQICLIEDNFIKGEENV